MKYYKITNKEENHNGFQYKDGLNIDTIEFDPNGSCRPGGLYYTNNTSCGDCWVIDNDGFTSNLNYPC